MIHHKREENYSQCPISSLHCFFLYRTNHKLLPHMLMISSSLFIINYTIFITYPLQSRYCVILQYHDSNWKEGSALLWRDNFMRFWTSHCWLDYYIESKNWIWWYFDNSIFSTYRSYSFSLFIEYPYYLENAACLLSIESSYDNSILAIGIKDYPLWSF